MSGNSTYTVYVCPSCLKAAIGRRDNPPVRICDCDHPGVEDDPVLWLDVRGRECLQRCTSAVPVGT